MHVMIDLETMGTSPSAPIIALGAVAFDDWSISETTFYREVDLKSSVNAGGIIDPETVIWWMKQSDEARAALCMGGDPLKVVLAEFTNWMDTYAPDACVWGNGAAFDNVILAEAYRRLDMPRPWPFYRDRCYRTMKSLFPTEFAFQGVHHNAVDDATNQALHLQEIARHHGNFLTE